MWCEMRWPLLILKGFKSHPHKKASNQKSNGSQSQVFWRIQGNLSGTGALLFRYPSVTPHAPAHHAQLQRHSTPYESACLGWNPSVIMVVHMHFSVNTTIDIYMCDPFWCAVTLACVFADALGISEGQESTNRTYLHIIFLFNKFSPGSVHSSGRCGELQTVCCLVICPEPHSDNSLSLRETQ